MGGSTPKADHVLCGQVDWPFCVDSLSAKSQVYSTGKGEAGPAHSWPSSLHTYFLLLQHQGPPSPRPRNLATASPVPGPALQLAQTSFRKGAGHLEPRELGPGSHLARPSADQGLPVQHRAWCSGSLGRGDPIPVSGSEREEKHASPGCQVPARDSL